MRNAKGCNEETYELKIQHMAYSFILRTRWVCKFIANQFGWWSNLRGAVSKVKYLSVYSRATQRPVFRSINLWWGPFVRYMSLKIGCFSLLPFRRNALIIKAKKKKKLRKSPSNSRPPPSIPSTWRVEINFTWKKLQPRVDFPPNIFKHQILRQITQPYTRNVGSTPHPSETLGK